MGHGQRRKHTTAADESSYVFDGVSAFESSPLGGLVATTVSDLKQAMTVIKPHRWKLDSRKILNSRRLFFTHLAPSPIGTRKRQRRRPLRWWKQRSMKSLLCDPLALVQELLTEALALAAIMNASTSGSSSGSSSRKRSRSRSCSRGRGGGGGDSSSAVAASDDEGDDEEKDLDHSNCRAAGAYVSRWGVSP